MGFIYERKINYYETDKMGVVHHSNYIRFLEEARCKMLEKYGMAYSEYEENGIMIPVLGVNASFKHHVSFDDTILIDTVIKDFNGVRLTVGYTITDKKSNKVVFTGETKHCFTDTNLRPLRLQKARPKFYDIYMSLIEKN